MDTNGVTNMAGGIDQYGAGTVAIAIIFFVFLLVIVFLMKMVNDNNKALLPVLQALKESIDGLTTAQTAVRDLISEKIGETNHQVAALTNTLSMHSEDCKRKEGTANEILKCVIKTEDRTKACSTARIKDGMFG